MLSAYDIGSSPIELRKQGYHDASFDAKTGIKKSIYGNIIFGGIGGVIIDGASGNAIDTVKSIYVNLSAK